MPTHVDRFFSHVAQMPLGNPAMHGHEVFAKKLRDHFAIGRQIGKKPTVVDTHVDIDIDKAATQCVAHRRGEIRPIQSRFSR